MAAVTSLGKLGIASDEVVSALLKALQVQVWSMRIAAATSLGELRIDRDEALNALRNALHDVYPGVRVAAATSLGKLGIGSNEVVSALLNTLHDTLQDEDESVRVAVVESLGQLGIRSEIDLNQVLVALNNLIYNEFSYDEDAMTWRGSIRAIALKAIRQLLDGHSLPGYRWISLQQRRQQRLLLKRIAFCLSVAAIVLLISLGSVWLLGYLNRFILYSLSILAASVTFTAAIAQIRRRSLHDPWERK